MSVLIKTMTDLPEHCYDCPCHDGESGYCQADKEHRYSDYRPFWCSLAKQEQKTRNEVHNMIDIIEIKRAVKDGQIKAYIRNGKIYLQNDIGEVVEIGKLEPNMDGGTQHEN